MKACIAPLWKCIFITSIIYWVHVTSLDTVIVHLSPELSITVPTLDERENVRRADPQTLDYTFRIVPLFQQD
jgi:hypothetical protein